MPGKTLNPNYFYLDSGSSFYQIFSEELIKDLEKVSITLRAGCNPGSSYSDKKGYAMKMFYTWLVRDGIANLIPFPQLERDGYRITYDTLTEWVVHAPN